MPPRALALDRPLWRLLAASGVMYRNGARVNNDDDNDDDDVMTKPLTN